VTKCIREGGKELRYAQPLVPKGNPLYAAAVYGIGPDDGHVGVILSLRPKVTAGLLKVLELRHEYRAVPTRDRRAIMLFDFKSKPADRALTIKCAEG
jgi:hypothetical protein